jgi:hypothetical protein
VRARTPACIQRFDAAENTCRHGYEVLFRSSKEATVCSRLLRGSLPLALALAAGRHGRLPSPASCVAGRPCLDWNKPFESEATNVGRVRKNARLASFVVHWWHHRAYT